MVMPQSIAILLWSLLGQTAAGFYSFNANYPNTQYGSSQNSPLIQNNVYSSLQIPHPPVSLMQGTGYNQLSTCVYINLISPTPLLQQFPLLSYLAGDTPTAELVLQLESEFQTSSIYIGGNNKATFQTFPSPNQWTHVCITWDGSLGDVIVYMDGQIKGRNQGIQTGYQIPANGIWSVGQAQPEVGHVIQLHVWDKVISEFEVQQVQSCSLNGNILSWDPSSMVLTAIDTSVGDPCASETQTESCLEFPVTSSLDQDYLPEEMWNYYVEGVFDKELPKQREFSVCAWLFIEEGVEVYPLIVYDIDGFEIFTLYISWDGNLELELGDEVDYEDITISNLEINYYDWQHYCIAWSGHNGKIQVYVNGDLQHVIRDFMTGYSLPSGSSLWVYQIQYESLYEDDPTEGFALKTTDVNWWDHVITQEEAMQVSSCPGSLPGNIVNWNEDALVLNDFWPEEEAEVAEEKTSIEETATVAVTTEATVGMTCVEHITTSKMDSVDPKVRMNNVVTGEIENGLPYLGQQFSMCFWVYYKDIMCEVINKLIILGDSDSITICNGFKIVLDGTEWQSEILADSTAWTHFCFIWHVSGHVKLYKNGIIAKDLTDTLKDEELNPGRLRFIQIQNDPYVGDNPITTYTSKITEFNMWDRVLDADEAYKSFCIGLTGNIVNSGSAFMDLTYEQMPM